MKKILIFSGCKHSSLEQEGFCTDCLDAIIRQAAEEERLRVLAILEDGQIWEGRTAYAEAVRRIEAGA